MAGSRHAVPRSPGPPRWLLLLAGVVVLLGVGALIGALVRGATDTTASTATPANAASPVSAPDPLPSRPTMLAQVARVTSGDEVVARVGSTEMPVRILGVTTPEGPQCGGREALAYADAELTGEMVTLVPDPTLPELDEQGRRLSYVVLRTQLSFTDAAIRDGIGRADTTRPLWYADVFAREQAAAVDAEVGIWGEPCGEKP